jgi:flagellar hook assembly protein FlgD
VFTPNGDDKNDVFSAFNVRKLCNEGNCDQVPLELLKNCARFVEEVKFSVYNRWGQKVYSYQSDTGSENTIYIDWNGKDSSGALVEPGVYFYVAEVRFITVEPKESVKTYKSWVHILYDNN